MICGLIGISGSPHTFISADELSPAYTPQYGILVIIIHISNTLKPTIFFVIFVF